MVFAVEKIKKKCKICGREFEYNSVGERLTELFNESVDIDNGNVVGVELGKHFICKDCFPEFISFYIDSYKHHKRIIKEAKFARGEK